MENQIISLCEKLRNQVVSMHYDVGPIIQDEQIHTDNLRQCKKYLNLLVEVKELLRDLTRNVDSKIGYVHEKYHESINMVNRLLGDVMARNHETTAIADDQMQDTTEQFIHMRQIDAHERIYVKGKLFVNAIRVHAVSQVLSDGNVYYIEPINHFAFRLGGKLFHGNIGNIINHVAQPGKVKDCAYGNKCNHSNCMFYHDPLAHGGNDVRNFYGSNDKMRMSYDTLETDVSGIPDDKLRIFQDQITHDMLSVLMVHHFYSE